MSISRTITWLLSILAITIAVVSIVKNFAKKGSPGTPGKDGEKGSPGETGPRYNEEEFTALVNSKQSSTFLNIFSFYVD